MPKVTVDVRSVFISIQCIEDLLNVSREIDRQLNIQHTNSPNRPAIISEALRLQLGEILDGNRLSPDSPTTTVEIRGGVADITTTSLVRVTDHDSGRRYLQHYDLQTPLPYEPELMAPSEFPPPEEAPH